MADTAELRRGDDGLHDDDRDLTPARVASAPRVEHADEVVPASKIKKRRSWLRSTLFGLLPLALLAGGYEYVTGGQTMSTDNAYVQADMVGVATDVSGIVQSIDVHENQHVQTGEVLFRLDGKPMQLALDRADAGLGIVRNDLTALKASYRDMQAQIDAAKADVAFCQAAYERQDKLNKSNFASRAAYDEARHDLDVSEQKLASLKQQAAGIAARLDGNPGPADRAASTLQGGRRGARRSGARTVPHGGARIDGRDRHQRTCSAGRPVPQSRRAGVQLGGDRPSVGRGLAQGDRTHLRPPRPDRFRCRWTPIRAWFGRGRSTASARPRVPASRCCRRRTPRATG